MAQSDVHLTDDQEVAGLISAGSGNIDHEIFKTVILSLPLIQEEQFSVSEERMYTSTGPSCSKLTMVLVYLLLKL